MPRKQIYSQVHIHKKHKMPDEESVGIHCYKRLRIMITLGVLSREIVDRKKFANIHIDFDGAKIQDGKGTRNLGTEAAHNLPRNILINGCSMWEYADDQECNFHKRIKQQLFFQSASTVVVRRDANYIDSQWERNGLMDIFVGYVHDCIRVRIGEEGEIKSLLEIGKDLMEGCASTLDATENIIKGRKTYQNKKSKLDEIFGEYRSVIKEFDCAYFIKKWVRIYRLPQYSQY